MWTPQTAYDEARAAASKSPFYKAMADHMLKSYDGWLPGRSRQEITKILNQSNRERLDAVPSLTKYPELRGMRELIEAQWRGTRDGANLDEAQAAVNANGSFYYHRVIAGGRLKPKANCSVVFFGTSDHGPLIAANLDTNLDEPFGAPDWPTTNEHLVTGGVSSGVFLDEESPEIFPAPVFKLMARYCRTAEEAAEMLTRYNHFWGPGNLLVADRNKKIAMIEKTACRIAVRFSNDGFGYVTAMTAEDPGIAAFLKDRRLASLEDRGLPNPCADTRYWASQDKRRLLMNRMMDEARKAPTVEKLRSIMQYRGPDGMVAGNGDVMTPGDPPIEHTLRTQIVCLKEGRAMWWARDNAKNIPSWQNRKEDVNFKDVLVWD